MKHFNLEGQPYEIGKKLGLFFRENKVEFQVKLNKNQEKHGKESLRILETVFPEAAEEIKGIAQMTIRY